MLKLAFSYQEKLNQAWQEIVFKEKYQFYNFDSYWNYKIALDEHSWNKIQMVSVDKNDNILGYLSASINRDVGKASSIGIINFGEINITFSRDLYTFLTDLFTKHHLNKIEWSVVIGNPAELMYDKIVEKYGGRVVGVWKESTRTADGTLRDVKDYELFRTNYLARLR